MRMLGLVMILGCVLLLGCENKQLVQCQQDLAASQRNLTKAQEDNAKEKKTSEQMLSTLMTQQQEEVKKLKKQIEQARKDEKARHEAALKNAYTKQKDLTQSILELQGTIRQLKSQQNEMSMKLAQADKQAKEREKKITNSGDMLQALAAENKKLKAENTKLKSMIDELQKKLDDKKDADNIE